MRDTLALAIFAGGLDRLPFPFLLSARQKNCVRAGHKILLIHDMQCGGLRQPGDSKSARDAGANGCLYGGVRIATQDLKDTKLEKLASKLYENSKKMTESFRERQRTPFEERQPAQRRRRVCADLRDPANLPVVGKKGGNSPSA